MGGTKEQIVERIVEYRSRKYSMLSPDQYPEELKKIYLLKDGSIKVGELTFTSAGGTCLWNPEEWDYRLGEIIHLPTD